MQYRSKLRRFFGGVEHLSHITTEERQRHYYFPTHIFNGGGKSSSVLRFFSKFCQNSTLYNSTPLTQSPCSAFILHTEMGIISKVKMGLRSKGNKI